MPYSVEERRINNSKQNAVNKVHAKPTVNSLSEGEEVVYQGRNEPLARYRKEGGKLWVSYMTSDGNIYVPKNLDVDGIIFSSGEEVVQADAIVPTQVGGTGADLSGATGAISVSSGSVAAGTLAIANGGTAVTANTTWLNTNVVSTASGVLAYDGNATAPSLPSISGTLTAAKGGTGQDLSSSTGAISVSSGTVSAGTLSIANGGTNAANSNGWLNTRVKIQTDGTLEYDNTTDGAVTMNTLADANNIRSRITGSLDSSNGLKSGVAIGDGVKRITIYNGANKNTIAANTDDATPSTDLYWRQSDTTYVKKIEFNYVHDSDILSLALFCNLYQSGIGSSPTAYARLVLYQIVAGGTSPIAASSTILESGAALAEVSTTSATYVPLESGKLDVSGLTAGSEDILYRVAVEMKSSESAITAHMTGVAVVAWGA